METIEEYENAMMLLLEDIPNWQYTVGLRFAA
jgi:hypothetical protein